MEDNARLTRAGEKRHCPIQRAAVFQITVIGTLTANVSQVLSLMVSRFRSCKSSLRQELLSDPLYQGTN